MRGQEYYSLRELAEHWSSENKNVTVKQILHMGLREEIDIFVRKSAIAKLSFPDKDYGIAFEISTLGGMSAEKHDRYAEKYTKSNGDFYKVLKEQLQEIELLPLDGTSYEIKLIFLDDDLGGGGHTSLSFHQFNRKSPLQPMTVNIDCFYVFQEDLLKFENKAAEGVNQTSSKPTDNTYELIVGVLLREHLSGGKQSAFIEELIKKYGTIKGISKTSLENAFAAGNKQLKKYLSQNEMQSK